MESKLEEAIKKFESLNDIEKDWFRSICVKEELTILYCLNNFAGKERKGLDYGI